MKNKFILVNIFKSRKLILVLACVIILVLGYIGEKTFGQIVIVYLGANVIQKFKKES